MKNKTQHHMFRRFDRDGKGHITVDDWQTTLRDMNILATAEEAEELFHKLDKDEDGVLKLAEFTEGLAAHALGVVERPRMRHRRAAAAGIRQHSRVERDQ